MIFVKNNSIYKIKNTSIKKMLFKNLIWNIEVLFKWMWKNDIYDYD